MVLVEDRCRLDSHTAVEVLFHHVAWFVEPDILEQRAQLGERPAAGLDERPVPPPVFQPVVDHRSRGEQAAAADAVGENPADCNVTEGAALLHDPERHVCHGPDLAPVVIRLGPADWDHIETADQSEVLRNDVTEDGLQVLQCPAEGRPVSKVFFDRGFDKRDDEPAVVCRVQRGRQRELLRGAGTPVVGVHQCEVVQREAIRQQPCQGIVRRAESDHRQV